MDNVGVLFIDATTIANVERSQQSQQSQQTVAIFHEVLVA
jgi:hypothetical protein